MNDVVLTYNPYQFKSKILIDNAAVSPYSIISNYLLEPFDRWCETIASSIAQELNDEFNLTFVSGKLETMMLESIIKSHCPDCISFNGKGFENDLSSDERVKILYTAVKENGTPFVLRKSLALVFDTEETARFFYPHLMNNTSLAVDDTDGTRFRYKRCKELFSVEINTSVAGRDEADAYIFVFSSEQSARSFCNAQPSLSKNAVIIIFDESFQTISVHEKKYILSMSQDMFSERLTDFIDFLIIISELSKVANHYKNENINTDGEMTYKTVTAVEPIIIVSCDSQVETGKSIDITVKTIPDTSSIPNLSIKSSNEKILKPEDNRMIGIDSGEVIIEVYSVGSVIPIMRKHITVIKRTRIEKITFSVDSLVLEVLSNATLQATVYPQNSDNLGELTWKSSNPNIADVDNKGNITTKKAGVCSVTLSAGNIFAECRIEVMPQAAFIQLPQKYGSSIQSVIKQQIPFEAAVKPDNAFNKVVTWKVLQNTECIKYDGKYIHTVGIGRAVIEFASADQKKQAKCHVQVISTLYQKPNPYKTIALILLIAGAILSMLQPVGMIVASCTLLMAGLAIMRDIKNRDEASKLIGNTKKVSAVASYIILILGIASVVYNITTL